MPLLNTARWDSIVASVASVAVGEFSALVGATFGRFLGIGAAEIC